MVGSQRPHVRAMTRAVPTRDSGRANGSRVLCRARRAIKATPEGLLHGARGASVMALARGTMRGAKHGARADRGDTRGTARGGRAPCAAPGTGRGRIGATRAARHAGGAAPCAAPGTGRGRIGATHAPRHAGRVSASRPGSPPEGSRRNDFILFCSASRIAAGDVPRIAAGDVPRKAAEKVQEAARYLRSRARTYITHAPALQKISKFFPRRGNFPEKCLSPVFARRGVLCFLRREGKATGKAAEPTGRKAP